MKFLDPSLLALAAVERAGSFDGAAAALGITPSAVSQRIKHLEERVGAVLIQRGQPCVATDTGRKLCRHAEQVALLERGLTKDLGEAMSPDTAAIVRIAVNADSVATWFLDALKDQGDLLFDIVIDDQDHSADLLRRGEVVAAISSSSTAVQGCDVTPLGALRYIATANPDYRDRWFRDGVTLSALRKAPAMTYNMQDGLQQQWIRQEIGQGASLPSHYLPSTQAFVLGAYLGIGWGMNPEILVRDHMARGALVGLGKIPHLDIPLYWQCNRLVSGPLRDISKAIRQAAKRGLVQP
ncbi:MAG: LysR family transcriptional regulator ArgP [Pseudoruegeria sp.]